MCRLETVNHQYNRALQTVILSRVVHRTLHANVLFGHNSPQRASRSANGWMDEWILTGNLLGLVVYSYSLDGIVQGTPLTVDPATNSSDDGNHSNQQDAK